MNTTTTSIKTVCVLGATGSIGFETTVHALRAGCKTLAVARDADKLRGMLGARGMNDPDGLSVAQMDLFAENAMAAPSMTQQMMACDYIFNAASKPVSFAPWSRTNREWDAAVSSLTRMLVEIASRSEAKPHIVAFCGTEYFVGHDGKIGFVQKAMPKLVNRMSAALRDNHDEALFLLGSGYGRWSVFRSGSIRPSSGRRGDGSRIGMNLHKDGSDYRRGKGKSLVAEDLAAYLADAIQSGAFAELEGEMPFLFNTRF